MKKGDKVVSESFIYWFSGDMRLVKGKEYEVIDVYYNTVEVRDELGERGQFPKEYFMECEKNKADEIEVVIEQEGN